MPKAIVLIQKRSPKPRFVLVMQFRRFQFLQGVFTGEERYLLLETFNSGEELEDHEKNEDKSGEDNGIDIALDTDQLCKYVAEIGKQNNGCHTTPDDDSDPELQDGLMIFSFQVIVYALIEHETGENEDDDLIELERAEVHRLVIKK